MSLDFRFGEDFMLRAAGVRSLSRMNQPTLGTVAVVGAGEYLTLLCFHD
jgi:hypothetical protein